MKTITKRFFQIAGLVFSFYFSLQTAFSITFSLPPPEQSLLGNVQYSYLNSGETVSLVGQRYDVGYNSIVEANPSLANAGFSSSNLIIPTLFLLPPVPRKGIVINLPEMRMYYFPKNTNVVMTFPIGIGRVGRTIPITTTAVTRKAVDPTWRPTPAIREFNREQGIELPNAMGPGPDNPLGPYAIYLRVPTYLIHSTIFPDSVGKRASFGCIRMNESDIRTFFPLVTPGTPVAIINMPSKVNWEGNQLFLEVHTPLEEHSNEYLATLEGIKNAIEVASRDKVVMVDWDLVEKMARQHDGLPRVIGKRVK